jgi:hypothetical protein
VASERQIAANRRNAQNSTGPRSGAGKKRASRNSYRHGLGAKLVPSAERAKRIENVARKIAGDAADVDILELARTAAQAELDLARIRQVRVALIQRLSAVGTFDVPQGPSERRRDVMDSVITFGQTGKFPKPVDAAATMPQTEPGRAAEAMRGALPELLKLDRYEQRAAGRRERSVRTILDRILYNNNL